MVLSATASVPVLAVRWSYPLINADYGAWQQLVLDSRFWTTMPVVARAEAVSRVGLTARQLVKRDNWASENAGVVLVFCIVFIVAVGLIILFIYRKLLARKAARTNATG